MPQITCPDCNQAIPSSEVNLQTGLARCAGCDTVFSVQDQLSGAEAAHKKSLVTKPANLTWSTRGRRLEMVQPWFNWGLLAMLIFVIPWDFFLFFWYGIAINQASRGHVDIIMFVFPIGHVAIGAGMTYAVLCGFLNKTYVEVDSTQLKVSFRPLPAPGQQTVAVRELDQLFCEEKINHGKNGTWKTYDLTALLKDGKKVKLLKSLQGADVARFIEQKVEEHLGIQDRPVEGEFAG